MNVFEDKVTGTYEFDKQHVEDLMGRLRVGFLVIKTEKPTLMNSLLIQIKGAIKAADMVRFTQDCRAKIVAPI